MPSNRPRNTTLMDDTLLTVDDTLPTVDDTLPTVDDTLPTVDFFFFFLETTVIQYNTIQYKMGVEYKKNK